MFHLAGFERQGLDLPRELAVGETARVTFGVFNSEQQQNSYAVHIWLDGQRQYGLGPVVLNPEEKWKEVATFTPQRAGRHQKVELVLHKNGEQSAEEPLYFWINVRAGE